MKEELFVLTWPIPEEKAKFSGSSFKGYLTVFSFFQSTKHFLGVCFVISCPDSWFHISVFHIIWLVPQSPETLLSSRVTIFPPSELWGPSRETVHRAQCCSWSCRLLWERPWAVKVKECARGQFRVRVREQAMSQPRVCTSSLPALSHVPTLCRPSESWWLHL